MSVPLVIRDDKDGLATLTLNRPEKLNALTPQVFVELRRHIEAIAQDTSIHCVVLAGSGRSFAPGMTLPRLHSANTGLFCILRRKQLMHSRRCRNRQLLAFMAIASREASNLLWDAICLWPRSQHQSAIRMGNGA